MDMIITLIMGMVTQVYTYVPTHQIVFINYTQFLYTNYTSTKVEKIEAS